MIHITVPKIAKKAKDPNTTYTPITLNFVCKYKNNFQSFKNLLNINNFTLYCTNHRHGHSACQSA